MIRRLSETSLRRLAPGAYRDAASPLEVRVRPGGAVTFSVRYQATGPDGVRRQRRKTLGRWPACDLETARTRAWRVRHGEEAPDAGDGPRLFEDVLEAFLEHRGRALRPRTIEYYRNHARRFAVPAFAGRAIDSITRREITELVDFVVNQVDGRGVTTANGVRRTLSALFSWSLARDLVDTNPVVGTATAGRERPREVYLADEDLARIAAAIAADTGPGARVYELVLRTAQRPGDVAGTTWDELDLARAWWLIPAARYKGGRAQLVPLTATVVARLEHHRAAQLAAATARGEALPPHVFATHGRRGHYNRSARTTARLARAAGVTGWSPHVLRKTASHSMARLGIEPHIRAAVLGHKPQGVTARAYTADDAWLYAEAKRAALEAWEAHLSSLSSDMKPLGT